MQRIDGEPVVFRRFWSSERDQVRDHLVRLDPEDRHLRFGGAPSAATIEAYVERVDWARALVVGCEVGGGLRGLGELKLLRPGDGPPMAEVAVTVEKAFQGHGIGTRLFRRLTTLAANRGVRRLYVLCLARNERMRHIVLRYNAELTRYESEIEGRILLPWPSHASYAQEFLDAYVATVHSALVPHRIRG
jgi:GNAT superfamily N-acetyltransferase